MKFDVVIVLFFSLVWAGILTAQRRKKSRVYLMFFSIFYIYLVTVLYYALFQFQSLIVMKLFNPRLMLNGFAARKALNLIPLFTLTAADLQTSLLNILLMVPFGFGLPFISTYRMKKEVVTGSLFSLAIELTQWLTGRVAGVTFRVADVNDVIFNTLGAAIGYLLFVGFLRTWRRVSPGWEKSAHPILRYIAERPQIDT